MRRMRDYHLGKSDALLPSRAVRIHSAGHEETLAAGRDVGRRARAGTVVALTGKLGSGKTVFARGVAEGLGVVLWRGSPTYNLVHEYAGRLPLFHIDAYRICSAELWDLDLQRMIEANGVLVVEWAENVVDALDSSRPAYAIRVLIADHGGDRREIVITQ